MSRLVREGIFNCLAASLIELLLPAKKRGLRTWVVSGSVCVCVCCCFDLLYGPILIDQSESRVDVWAHSD